MGNFTQAFLIVIGINVMLWLGQFAMLEVNPTATNFLDEKGNLFGKVDSGNYELNETDPYGMLPKGKSAIDPDTGNIFTDIFNSIKDWFADNTGARYLIAIISAPYNFLKAMHLPQEFVFVVGTMWYLVTILIGILMIWGRDT